jgi:NADH-quinone oxidoreductase subunit L
MNLWADFSLHHAWLIPLLPALAFLVISFFFLKSPWLAARLAIAAMTASFALALGMGWAVLSQGITVEAPFVMKTVWYSMPGLSVDMGVLVDPISATLLFVVTLITLMVLIYSVGYMAGDPGYCRFFAFISLFAASMLAMGLATNFLQMFVFWELVGLCSYLLIGFYFFKISAREAGKKAFMTTRIGDFGLLLGILLLQMMFGTLDFAALGLKVPAYVASHGTAALTGVAILIFMGPVAKSGQFPLHVWLPDAMEGPTPVSALIHAATMVVAGVYLIARSFGLFHVLPGAMTLIAWLGVFTALFAAFIALTQKEIKRILAFSTISQLGFMMLALGVGSLTASMFHLMTHAFFKALLFLGAGSILHAIHDQADIFKMGGLRKSMPATCIMMGIAVLAIAGIPPFAGFFSKDEILVAAAHVSVPLYILASLAAFMTAFYMARLFIVAFLGEPNPHNHPHESGLSMLFPMGVLAVLSVIGGWLPFSLGFGDWVRFGPAHHAGIDWAVAGASTVISLAGFALAWVIYGRGPRRSDALAAKSGLLYSLSYNKFFVDELYQWFNRNVIDGLGRLSFWIDLYVLGAVVDGASRATGTAGTELRYTQTGQMQQYAAVMVSATVVLVLLLAVLTGSLVKGGQI